jgi:hypothetical protein
MEVSQTGGDEQGDHDLKDYNRICWRARIFGRLSMTRAILGLWGFKILKDLGFRVVVSDSHSFIPSAPIFSVATREAPVLVL